MLELSVSAQPLDQRRPVEGSPTASQSKGPALLEVPREVVSRMSAFDSIVEDHEWDEFHGAGSAPAPAPAPLAPSPPPPDPAMIRPLSPGGLSPSVQADFSRSNPFEVYEGVLQRQQQQAAQPLPGGLPSAGAGGTTPPRSGIDPFAEVATPPAPAPVPVHAEDDEWDDFQGSTAPPPEPPSPLLGLGGLEQTGSAPALPGRSSPLVVSPPASKPDALSPRLPASSPGIWPPTPPSADTGGAPAVVAPPVQVTPPPSEDEWGDFTESPTPPAAPEAFPLHKEDINLGSTVQLASPTGEPPVSDRWSAFKEDGAAPGPRSPGELSDAEKGDFMSCSLEELLQLLKSRELLEVAYECELHLEAGRGLKQANQDKDRAVTEERFEDAIALRNRIKEFQDRIKSEECIRIWRESECT
jgi:hypothetical protein